MITYGVVGALIGVFVTILLVISDRYKLKFIPILLKLVLAWIFLFTVIYYAVVSANGYNYHAKPDADAVRYRLEKTGKYTPDQIEEYIKIRGFE
jgi:energy-coupling factor transporter transmembrane protein EcfT